MVHVNAWGLSVDVTVLADLNGHALPWSAPSGLSEINNRSPEFKDDFSGPQIARGEDAQPYIAGGDVDWIPLAPGETGRRLGVSRRKTDRFGDEGWRLHRAISAGKRMKKGLDSWRNEGGYRFLVNAQNENTPPGKPVVRLPAD